MDTDEPLRRRMEQYRARRAAKLRSKVMNGMQEEGS